LPENLLLLGRSLAILSGMCSGLDPGFNLWTSIAPYVSTLVSDEDASTLRVVPAEAAKFLQVAVGLPGRADRVLTLMERGDLNVQTPLLTMQVRRLDRSVNRIVTGLIFAALLVAGAIVYGSGPGLGRVLMIASGLPLLWLMLSGRGRHPGRR
jgi:predicted unusual protein kinase regulating ubiquinone biosynthesis (AarF/ABC1/UbiB family)